MGSEADPPLGEVVTILRLVRGWNQRQLADAAGLSESAISLYERDEREVPIGPLVATMGFLPHLPDCTRSFARRVRAAREAHLAAATLPLAGWIDLFAGELAIWLEGVTREGLAPAPASPVQDDPADARVVPWWQRSTVPAPRAAGPRTPLGKALAVLRTLAGWDRHQLAAALGRPEPTLANWERGTSRPPLQAIDRMLERMGFPAAAFPQTLDFVESALAASLSPGSDPASRWQTEAIVAHAVQSFEEFTRRSVTSLVAAAQLLETRRAAPALWERFRSCSEAGQLDVAREAADFHTSGFVELLCEESRNAAGDSAARARHLATCAVLAAAVVPGSPGWRSRLAGFARAHLASAERVGGDLNLADRETSAAHQLWQAGAADDPGLLNAARVLHLEASLRREQRCIHQALALLDQALELDRRGRWGETPSLLLGKAFALDELGQHEAALALLPQVESRLDRQRQPRHLVAVRNLTVRSLCHLGRYAEAELALAPVRPLAVQLGNQLDLLRVDWLRGTVAAGLDRTEEAIEALSDVRAGFRAQDNAYDTALVTLELAEVYATLGRNAEVKALARESAPVFQAQGVHREARQALTLFRQAAEQERATVELVHAVVTYLYRSRHDARVRFHAAA
jgi:transcriptional regulator with XRE-family HTH domain